MNEFSLEKRVEIHKILYRNEENFADTLREVYISFERNEVSTRSKFVDINYKFESLR